MIKPLKLCHGRRKKNWESCTHCLQNWGEILRLTNGSNNDFQEWDIIIALIQLLSGAYCQSQPSRTKRTSSITCWFTKSSVFERTLRKWSDIFSCKYGNWTRGHQSVNLQNDDKRRKGNSRKLLKRWELMDGMLFLFLITLF
jgi:hypothetical protein